MVRELDLSRRLLPRSGDTLLRLPFSTLVAISSIFVSASIVRSEPRSAKDCAAIDESFAYNECIAKFGPSGNGKIAATRPAGAVLANAPAGGQDGLSDMKLAPEPPSAARGVPAPAAHAAVRPAAPARVSGSIYQRHANGRYFAVFQVARPAGQAATRAVAPPVARKVTAPARATWKPKTAAYARWQPYRRH